MTLTLCDGLGVLQLTDDVDAWRSRLVEERTKKTTTINEWMDIMRHRQIALLKKVFFFKRFLHFQFVRNQN